MDRLELITLAVGAAVAIRVMMHFVDKNRIRDEIEGKGGRIVSIRLASVRAGLVFRKERAPLCGHLRGSFGCHQVGNLQDQLFYRSVLDRAAGDRRAAAAILFAPSLRAVRVLAQRRLARLPELRQGNRDCVTRICGNSFRLEEQDRS